MNILKNNENSKKGFYSAVKIKLLMSTLLNNIVQNELEKAYGNMWKKMTSYILPFTVEESIKYIKKYWMVVFSLNLLKQCKQCIDQFEAFLQKIQYCEYFIFIFFLY